MHTRHGLVTHSRSHLSFRLLLLAGVLGPLLFAVTVIVVGHLRPDYNHVNQFMSELAEAGAQFAWLMKYFGFMIPAALILAFVLAFRTRLPGTALSSIGTSLLVVFAVSMFLAGVFPCDVGCSPSVPSTDQKLHDLFSVLAFPSFTAGVFFWGLSLLRNTSWRRFGIYTLGTAVLSLVLLIAMIQSEASREGTGVYQRLYLGVLFLWLMVLSVRLSRKLKNGGTQTTVN